MRIPATVACASPGPHSGIVTVRVPRELLEHFAKGQQIDLVLSSSLSTSPHDSAGAAGASATSDAQGSEDDLSSPPTSTSSSRGSPLPRGSAASASEVGGPLPSTDTAELVQSFQPVSVPSPDPRPEAPQAPGTSAGGANSPAEASGAWMLTERQPDWDGMVAAAYTKGVKGAGYDVATLADLCEQLTEHHLRPRNLGVEGRKGLYRWVAYSDEGKAAYQAAKVAREQLVEAARRLRVKERKAAAEAAGTDTQPAELSARELWRLLEQAGPQSTAAQPPKPALPTPDPGTCRSCGADVVWVKGGGDVKHICDPEVHTASPKGSGARVALVGDDGVVRMGSLDPDGHIVGRVSHFSTCPDAEKHRKPRRRAKEDA